MTRQRRAVLECVLQADEHPSADEIYEIVRRTVPRVSLGTIYRTLAVLSELGLIRELDLVGQPKRFDGALTPHYHVRCAECDHLADLPLSLDPGLVGRAQELTGYRITGHHLEFVGLCPKCRHAMHAPHDDACDEMTGEE